MKKAEWQAVYAPQGDALERRVRQTLDGLADRPERAYPRRAVFVEMCIRDSMSATRKPVRRSNG